MENNVKPDRTRFRYPGVDTTIVSVSLLVTVLLSDRGHYAHADLSRITTEQWELRTVIFSRQASLARQAFLITPLHGARYKTGKKTLTPKSSAMLSYVKLMRHPQHWYFPQFRCNMRKISAKRYRRANLADGAMILHIIK